MIGLKSTFAKVGCLPFVEDGISRNLEVKLDEKCRRMTEHGRTTQDEQKNKKVASARRRIGGGESYRRGACVLRLAIQRTLCLPSLKTS
jgi:hypothetical protein